MQQKAKSIGRYIANFLQGELGLLLILILLCIGFASTSEFFLTTKNLLNITRQVSIVMIVSIGMLCVVLSGEIDLSVGSTSAIASVACAMMMLNTNSQPLAILAAVGIGLLAGLFNGAMTVIGKIPSFIVTLASMGIFRGLVLVWSDGKSISGMDDSFSYWGAGYMFGVIPVSTVIALAVIAFGYIFIQKTKHGIYIKAIGTNPEAATLSTIPIKRYKILGFVITGVMCALGGVINTSKLLSVQTTAGEGMEMDVLSAVILGGASLSGGIGSVTGTFLGALTIGVINNGMNLLRISPFFQQIVKGSIILIAVLIKRKKKN